MSSMDALSSYALVMGLSIVFLLVWLVQRQKSGKQFTLWLASGLTGMLLGSAISYAMVNASGYAVMKAPKSAADTSGTVAAGSSPTAGMPGGSGNGSPAGGGGMPGGMGGGMGGRGPNPKRDLTTMVRKLNLLTDDIAIKLTADQAAALVKCLTGVDEAEQFSDDDAKAMQAEVAAILTDEQKSKLDAIGLPFGGVVDPAVVVDPAAAAREGPPIRMPIRSNRKPA